MKERDSTDGVGYNLKKTENALPIQIALKYSSYPAPTYVIAQREAF